MAPPQLKPIDPEQNPYQSGRFAPIHEEIDTNDLVVEGDLPADLNGAFMRNGPNPKFTPLGSYLYPMEGDGMIHAVWFENGTARRYKNRWVETESMHAEERAGRAIFGGLMTPAFVDQSLLGPRPDPGWPIKLDAFINIIRHNGRYLALTEGLPPYEVTPELETVGLYDFDGGIPLGMGAHVRVDPAGGEMVFMRYDVEPPFLQWGTVAADGTVRRPPTEVPDVNRSYMIHDFTATPNYVVLVLGPTTINVDAMLNHTGDVIAWEPELGTRIAVIRRDGSEPIRWYEAETWWAWHYANAFEIGRDVVLDFPDSSSPNFQSGANTGTVGLTRATFGLDTGRVALTRIDDTGCEFPRVDERRTGLSHRFITVAARSDDPCLTIGEHDRWMRYDVVSGAKVTVDTGAAMGEAVFVPRPGGTDELDGYYLSFGTSLTDGTSALYVFDADNLQPEPRARVIIPHRVPNGLHANWIPAASG